MAEVLVLCRLCHPSSELHIAEHFFEQTALGDLLGVASDKINEDRLYRALDQVLPHKEALEQHLKERVGSLFHLDYDLFLYDVTSTYFEGEARINPLAQRGYSRDHRGDCKQICIGLVVSRGGFPLGYELFAGNRTDVTTVEDIVEKIEDQYGAAGEDLRRGRSGETRSLRRLLQGQCRHAGESSGKIFRRGNLNLADMLLSVPWSGILAKLKLRKLAGMQK